MGPARAKTASRIERVYMFVCVAVFICLFIGEFIHACVCLQVYEHVQVLCLFQGKVCVFVCTVCVGFRT